MAPRNAGRNRRTRIQFVAGPPLLGNLGLTDKEEDQIVAYLNTLTDLQLVVPFGTIPGKSKWQEMPGKSGITTCPVSLCAHSSSSPRIPSRIPRAPGRSFHHGQGYRSASSRGAYCRVACDRPGAGRGRARHHQGHGRPGPELRTRPTSRSWAVARGSWYPAPIYHPELGLYDAGGGPERRPAADCRPVARYRSDRGQARGHASGRAGQARRGPGLDAAAC